MHQIFNKIRQNSWVFIAVLLTLTLPLQQCTSEKPEKETRVLMLQSVDTLWNELQFVRSQFKFRMDEFVERKTDMEKQLIKAQFLDGSKLNETDKATFDKFNGVYRVYKSLASKYKQTVLAAEDVFYSIKGLEKEVKKGTYDEDILNFKIEYAALKKKLAENKTMAVDVTEKLTAVEPLYLRTSEIIEGLLEAQLPEKP
jgi:hypothetical protein